MKRYFRVKWIETRHCVTDVEADNEDEAIDKILSYAVKSDDVDFDTDEIRTIYAEEIQNEPEKDGSDGVDQSDPETSGLN